MFEAYAVAVTLKLHNLVSPQLALLAKEMEKLEALSTAIKSSFRALGAEAAGIRSITTATNATNAALERASRSAQGLQAHLAAARATGAAMPGIVPLPMGGGRGGGRAPGGGGGGGGAGRGHGGAGGAHGGNVHLGPGGVGIGTVGLGAGDAFVPLALTAGMVWGGHALYESARDYETAATRFKTLNLGAAVNKEAEAFARGTKVFGVASKDLMETLRESVGMFGNMPNALKLSPIIAQLNAANSGLFGGKIGSIDEGAARSLMRFNDMRGLTDSPQDFIRGLNLAQRMVTGSGGALKFTDLEQMAKRGGAAFKGMSDDGIMMMATLAQEQGGAATGTAMMSLYQNLIAGRTTKKTMAALENAGLVTLGSVNTGTVGGKKSTSTQITSIVDEKMLRENMGLWLMTYGTQAAKKAGAKTDSEVIAFMNSLLSNRQGSNLGANFTTQQMQALRDFKGTKRAGGAEETIDMWKKTAGGKEAEFIAAWSNFKTDFGTLMLPAFSNILTNSSKFMRGVSSFITENEAVASKLVSAASWLLEHNPLTPVLTALNAIRGLGGGAGVETWGNEARRGMQPSAFASNGGGAAFGGANIRGAPAASRNAINNTIVMPDGKVLAKVVTNVQAKELSRQNTGPRTFDSTMAPQGSW